MSSSVRAIPSYVFGFQYRPQAWTHGFIKVNRGNQALLSLVVLTCRGQDKIEATKRCPKIHMSYAYDDF
jgi:hypothetical protein